MTNILPNITISKQASKRMVKWGSGFETGWYMPGPFDPELRDEEEDRQALSAPEFYELLEKLSVMVPNSIANVPDSIESQDKTVDSDEGVAIC